MFIFIFRILLQRRSFPPTRSSPGVAGFVKLGHWQVESLAELLIRSSAYVCGRKKLDGQNFLRRR